MQFQLLSVLFLLACMPTTPPASSPLPAAKDTLLPTKDNIPKQLIGETIEGDFDGDGLVELATVVLVKKGEGNPIDGAHRMNIRCGSKTAGLHLLMPAVAKLYW